MAVAVDTATAGGPYVYVTGGEYGSSAVTIKYSSDGVVLASSTLAGVVGHAIAVDAAGNVWLAGSASTATRTWFAAKLDPNLALISSHVVTSASFHAFASDLVLDAAGNAFVSGTSSETGTGWIYRVVKYSPAMVVLDSATFDGGTGSAQARAIALDSAGYVIVTGYRSMGLLGIASDFLTVKFDSALTFVSSAVAFGIGGYSDHSLAVATDPSNNVYLTGQTNVGSGNSDFTIVKYDPFLVMLASASRDAGSAEAGQGLLYIDSGTLIAVGADGANHEFVFLQYDAALALVSSRTYGGSFSEHFLDSAYGVARGTGTYIYATGSTGNLSENYRTIRLTTPLTASPGYAGCGVVRNVGAGQDHATISAAMASLPASLTGPSCIVIRDGATYAEQVTVRGFTNNGYTLSILADPASGLTPVIAPPAASTAAFLIANASVSVRGFDIIPTAAMPYGIYISSSFVSISSVNVKDAGGKIAAAGVAASYWTTIARTSVTVGGGSVIGFWLQGSTMASISYSTAATNASAASALRFTSDASSNTITTTYLLNLLGTSVRLDPRSDYNAFSRTTMVSDGVGKFGLDIENSVGNTVTGSEIRSYPGTAVYLLDSRANTISSTTMVSDRAGFMGLHLINSDSNTVTGSDIQCLPGFGVYVAGSDYNSFSRSTMVANGATNSTALQFFMSGFNSVSDSFIRNDLGNAAYVGSGSNRNIIERSTMTSAAVIAGRYALYVGDSSSNTVLDSYIQGSSSTYITGSTGTVIGRSALVAVAPTGSALAMTGGSVDLTLASAALRGGSSGRGLWLDAGNGGTLSMASVTVSGAARGLEVSTQAPSFSLAVGSITFRGLSAGATAVHFLGGTFVSTITAARFEDASVRANVSGAALALASRITMRGPGGTRAGEGYENDPNGLVDWPDFTAPPVSTAPPSFSVASIAPSSGAAGTNPAATVAGDLFDGSATLALERGTGPGTWANTGSFGNSRKLGTLTKLSDGRVLLAGGEKQTSTNGLANADIFDPLTGVWTAGPPMLLGRTRFTALRLADGRVFVAGGLGPTGGPLPSAEIFDPAASTWTAVAPMSHIRWGHRMVALADGRLLVAGGNDGAVSLDTAEIYDPASNSWSAAGTMSTTRENATLTLLPNGNALVVGGPGATADLYDPETNAWSAAGTMSASRKDHQAALLPDGRVLVSGGRFTTAVATAEIYDPLTNSWTAAGSLTGRYEHAMVMVDGAPVILGGYSGATSLSSTQIYDAELNSWRAGPNLPSGRRNALAVALDDGRFLTASGASGSFTISVLNTAALLTVAQSSIPAAGLSSADAQHLSGTFDLNGAATGYWNVVVRKPGPLTARLDGGFKVYVATPAAPSGFAGAAVSSAAILWSWTDNSFDETGFSVLSGTISVSGPLPAGTTVWLQQGLPPDTAFGPYTVQASNSGGTAASGPAARTTLPAAPDAAGAPMGSALGVSSVAWTWSLASGASSYNLFRASDDGFLASSSSGAFTQTSLAPNTAYGLRSAGVNISGTGPLSAAGTAYTLAADPAGTGTAVTSTTIVASWTLNGNPASTVAELLRSTDAVAYSALTVGAVTSYAEADLLGCTTYHYRVRNLNGDGVPTAYASFSGVTANTVPSPPSGLTAAANAGGTVGLSWALSPTEGVTGYRLYWDAGTGTVSYAAALATLGAAATGYTTAVLTSSASYTFALRAAHRCGTVETTGALAMSGAAAALPAVRAAVKEPDSGRRVDGNRVTILGELLYGAPSDVQQVAFQYKAAADSVWLDVPAANINHGNPDLVFPYFVHWDVTALPAGDYDLRAVAYDRAGVPDSAPPAVRVAVDPITPDIDEGTTVDGKIKKDQKVANTVTNVVDTAGSGADDPAVRVTIPAGVVTSATATVSVIANPTIATAAPSGQSLVGSAVKIDLSNGQTALNGTAEITLTYPETVLFPSRLQIYYLDEVNGRWTRDFTSTVDTASRTVTGRTPHFSTFAIMLGAAFSPNLDSVQAYPVPYKPNGSNPDEGRAFSPGDANSGIIFANLASGSEIRIYTLTGRLVSSLDSPAAAGTLRWDARNQDGRDVASGAYFAVVSAPGQKSVVKKLVIIR